MPERTFPYLLTRYSSQPASEFIDMLGTVNCLEYLIPIEETDRMIGQKRSLLCDTIFKIYQTADQPGHQNRLLSIKRGIYNNRVLNETDVSFLSQYLDKRSREVFEEYLALGSKRKELWKIFENSYRQSIEHSRHSMAGLVQNEKFRNGLLLSSNVLPHQVDAYLSDTNSPSKKALRVESGLMKYLTRMYTRTTPFGAFTSIGIDQPEFVTDTIAPQLMHSRGPRTQTRLNLFLPHWLNRKFLKLKDIYLQLELALNSSLQREGERLLFYSIDECHDEAIHQLAVTPLLTQIIKLFETPGFKPTLEKLVQHFSDIFDQDEKELEPYFYDLLTLGLFQFSAGYRERINDPLNAIKDILEKQVQRKSSRVTDLIANIQLLLDTVERHENGMTYNRLSMWNETAVIIRRMFDILVAPGETVDPEDATMLEKIERGIYYEDHFHDVKLKINQDDYDRIITKLQDVIKHCRHSRYRYRDLIEATGLFLTLHNQDEKVQLLKFFSEYYRFKIESKDPVPGKYDDVASFLKANKEFRFEIKQQWIEGISRAIGKNIRYDSQYIDIPSSFFDDTGWPSDFNASDIHTNPRRNYTSSGHFFTSGAASGNKIMFLLSGSSGGYGRRLGRFLSDDYSSVVKELQLWNKRLMDAGEMFIDNDDASCSNSNIHPSLLPFKIHVQTRDQTTDESRITLDRLFVRFNSKPKEIELIDKNTNKVCRFFDLGLEVVAARSELYQFLSLFEINDVPVFHEFLRLLNKPLVKDGEIYSLPRITFDSDLVIQRRQWIVPASLLPRGMMEDELNYFVSINNWRKELGIPPRVFIRHEWKEGTEMQAFDNDNYKPQFIQFDNPFFLRIFDRLATRIRTNMVIEEMLPDFQQFPPIGDRIHPSEFLVQWTGA